MLTQNLASHKEHLRLRSEQIDRLNDQIQGLSSMQQSTLEELRQMKERVRVREERKAKIANLQRELAKKRATAKSSTNAAELQPEWLNNLNLDLISLQSDKDPNESQIQFAQENLPTKQTLKAYVNAYSANNDGLRQYADQLRSRSTELEAMYRKVVSLCTGVPEDKVEESLPSLVAAVESERGSLGEQEVGRVRDFLRKVEGGGGQQSLEVNPTVTALAAAAAAAAVK